MKIIKRNGSEQEFNPSKIHVAMTKAFRSVEEGKTVSEETIANLTAKAVAKVQEIPHTPNVEEVQDIVENVLMDSGFHDVSRSYIKYRFTHAVRRNTTDAAILSLIEAENEEKPKAKSPASVVAGADGDITFGYCTEYIVDKKPDAADAMKLRAYLESIGDSVVCVDDDDIIKVHVHTNNPGNAIQEGLKFGQLVNIKVDNMRVQHQSKVVEAEKTQNAGYTPVEPEKPFGFVAVAAGAGLRELFTDLGADQVVSGGQTMNPSTDDILRAIELTPAETVFVLPNNKNIIMAAEQAVKLADRKVCVLQTRTVPQGISAMLAFDPEQSYSDNRVAMTKQFDLVQTGLITFAARDSEFDGHAIKKGEILALDNGKLDFTDRDLTKALMRLVKHLIKKREASFITLIYGSDVTDEQAERARDAVAEKYGSDFEVNLINGGQPVYYYMISVE